MMKKFIPFGAPKISEDEIKEAVAVLRSGWIGMGPKVRQFEEKFKRYVGSGYALALNSCTAGLHLSLLVSGVRSGDEIITTPLTYAATGNAILQAGAKPVFADIDLKTYNIDPREIVKKINKKTKAIIPVHFGGLPCEMNQINKIAKRFHLKVIEDAAHAIGARYNGKMIGNSQNHVCFSFYPNKNITAGEGGMLTSNSNHLTRRLEILRRDGLSQDAWRRFQDKKMMPGLVIEPGFKYTLTDLQASLGLKQLEKVERWQKTREKYAEIYDKFFKKIPGVFLQDRPKDLNENRHSLHLYTLRIDPKRFSISRNKIVKKLLKKNIGASIHYIALHLHPYYQKQFGYKRNDFPKAELVSDNIFTLPLTPHFKLQEIEYIGKISADLLKKHKA